MAKLWEKIIPRLERICEKLTAPVEGRVKENRKWQWSEGIGLFVFKQVIALPLAVWNWAVFDRIIRFVPDRFKAVALDVWHYGTLGLLVWFNFEVFSEAKDGIPKSSWAWWCVVLSLLRVYEGVTTAILLHTGKEYKTHSKPRAITGVLMLFFTVAVAFASWFVYLHKPGPNDTETIGFRGDFLESKINPLYFSVVVVASYGDEIYAPTDPWQRFAVSSEVMISLLLLVIILQQAMQGEQPDDDKKETLLAQAKRLESQAKDLHSASERLVDKIEKLHPELSKDKKT